MDAVTLDRLWDRSAIYLAGTGHHPSRLLVLGTALVALAAVASSRIWPVSRTVVTIAHEGGHALMALLAGRRVSSVRVLRSTAGVTVSEGNPAGPGIVLTAAAGYLTPPLLGLGAAAIGEVLNAGIAKVLRVELDIGAAPGGEDRLRAAGVLVVNPPFGFAAEMERAGAFLARTLARGPDAKARVEMLAGEA